MQSIIHVHHNSSCWLHCMVEQITFIRYKIKNRYHKSLKVGHRCNKQDLTHFQHWVVCYSATAVSHSLIAYLNSVPVQPTVTQKYYFKANIKPLFPQLFIKLFKYFIYLTIFLQLLPLFIPWGKLQVCCL